MKLQVLPNPWLAAVVDGRKIFSAARHESRGAHSRTDYPKRDDKNWLKHTLYSKEGNKLDYKPVRLKPLSVETFPPNERIY